MNLTNVPANRIRGTHGLTLLLVIKYRLTALPFQNRFCLSCRVMRHKNPWCSGLLWLEIKRHREKLSKDSNKTTQAHKKAYKFPDSTKATEIRSWPQHSKGVKIDWAIQTFHAHRLSMPITALSPLLAPNAKGISYFRDLMALKQKLHLRKQPKRKICFSNGLKTTNVWRSPLCFPHFLPSSLNTTPK